MALGQSYRNTARALISPTTVDLAWAAGFLEGEASFSRSGKRLKKSSGISSCEMVAVSQTDSPEPMCRLYMMFGGKLSTRSKRFNRATGIGSRDQIIWYVSGARARGVMQTMYKLMSPRRQDQILKALGRPHADA